MKGTKSRVQPCGVCRERKRCNTVLHRVRSDFRAEFKGRVDPVTAGDGQRQTELSSDLDGALGAAGWGPGWEARWGARQSCRGSGRVREEGAAGRGCPSPQRGSQAVWAPPQSRGSTRTDAPRGPFSPHRRRDRGVAKCCQSHASQSNPDESMMTFMDE